MTIFKKNSIILSLVLFSVLLISMNLKNTNTTLADELMLIVSHKNPTASDKSDGTVSIEVKGGKAPYKLVLHTSTRANVQEYSGDKFEFNNLPKGFYLFNVTDSEGNFVSKNISL